MKKTLIICASMLAFACADVDKKEQMEQEEVKVTNKKIDSIAIEVQKTNKELQSAIDETKKTIQKLDSI